jgi:hypothetical protein
MIRAKLIPKNHLSFVRNVSFNEAFRKYYDGLNPIAITTELAQEKKIVIRPIKGGVMLYLPEDVPQSDKAGEVLKKMGLQ